MGRVCRLICTTLFAALLVASVTVAGAGPRAIRQETEPNDSPATANPLASQDKMQGSVMLSDTDYYALSGINKTWGYIAVLQSDQSLTLQALPSDGVTVLEQATGDGVAIALRNFADGSATHYLRVLPAGTAADYELQYYTTVVRTQPEVEPNDTLPTATVFGFTSAGVVDAAGDRDCFVFHGRLGDRILLALDSDPEDDAIAPAFDWSLYDPSGAQAWRLSNSGDGVFETLPLLEAGAYTVCVEAAGLGGGPTFSYKVGLLRNGGLYLPEQSRVAQWVDPPPSGSARVGDTLTFSLTFTNIGSVTIPDALDWRVDYDASCLALVSADPPATLVSSGSIEWTGLMSDQAPGETFGVVFTARALKPCVGTITSDIHQPYYFTVYGLWADYAIAGDQTLYLPVVR